MADRASVEAMRERFLPAMRVGLCMDRPTHPRAAVRGSAVTFRESGRSKLCLERPGGYINVWIGSWGVPPGFSLPRCNPMRGLRSVEERDAGRHAGACRCEPTCRRGSVIGAERHPDAAFAVHDPRA